MPIKETLDYLAANPHLDPYPLFFQLPHETDRLLSRLFDYRQKREIKNIALKIQKADILVGGKDL